MINIPGYKPLVERYQLTPENGAKLRARGWKVERVVERCVDCAAPTTWRSPDGLPQHPWDCR